MANTTNLDLVKPLGTDHALVSVINSNMDKIDAYAGKTDDAIGSIADGLAIVANGNTHAAITSGQFVYVRNHNTLSEGLYVATANIAQDETLSGSNLTADSSGGLNSVYSALNGNIANLIGDTSSGDWTQITNYTNGESWNGSFYTKIGKIVYIRPSVKGLTANSTISIFSLPEHYRPYVDVEFDGFGGNAYLNHAHFKITSGGVCSVYSADAYATGFISYPAR